MSQMTDLYRTLGALIGYLDGTPEPTIKGHEGRLPTVVGTKV